MLSVNMRQRLSLLYKLSDQFIHSFKLFVSQTKTFSAFGSSPGHCCICILSTIEILSLVTKFLVCTCVAYIWSFLMLLTFSRNISIADFSAIISFASATTIGTSTIAQTLLGTSPDKFTVFSEKVMTCYECPVSLYFMRNR